VYLQVNAQTTVATPSGTLLSDQNPNYQKSRDKYMTEATSLTKNEGVTIQETYKAIDDVQAKKERRELLSERRHERRMARIQSRSNRGQQFYNYPYNNGYYNNYFDNGYYSNSIGNYYSPYYSNNVFGNINPVLNTALFGLGMCSLFKH